VYPVSFSHWLKGATRIRFDDRTLGNVLKNGAVAGGTLVGGPLGLAIGGLGGIAGQAALGGNLGESLNAGLKGATNTGLAQAGKGLLTHALSSGAPGVSAPTPATPTPSVPSVAPAGVPAAADIAPGVPNLVAKAVPDAPKGFLTRALDAGKGAASFLGDHDKTTSALLSTAGDEFDPTKRRVLARAGRGLEQQNAQGEYDYNRRKAQDLALEPLRKALYGSLGSQIGENYAGVAPNPYAPRVSP
jgi:hypothetical protein